MSVICVSGCRNDRSFKERIRVLLKEAQPEKVIVGCCKNGVDRSTREVCIEEKICCHVYEADWDKYGLRAGYLRNQAMIDEKPDAVWTFHKDIENSKGTKMTRDLALKAGIKVVQYNFGYS